MVGLGYSWAACCPLKGAPLPSQAFAPSGGDAASLLTLLLILVEVDEVSVVLGPPDLGALNLPFAAALTWASPATCALPCAPGAVALQLWPGWQHHYPALAHDHRLVAVEQGTQGLHVLSFFCCQNCVA
jgi:hypothetical protein